MTRVESNNAIAIATRNDWFKNLAPVYQPMREKTKTNRDLQAPFFPRFEQVSEFGLVHCVVCTCCDWLKLYPWYLFYDTQLKTALPGRLLVGYYSYSYSTIKQHNETNHETRFTSGLIIRKL